MGKILDQLKVDLCEDDKLEGELDNELVDEHGMILMLSKKRSALVPLPGVPDVVSRKRDIESKGYPLFRFGMGREGG